MKLELIILDKSVKKFGREAKKKARCLAAVLRKRGVIEIYLIGDKRMRMLNKKFRGKDETTNVLSFVNPKDFPDVALGEVYLNPLFIEKNHQDLAQMMAHGVLHILGYDHIKKGDRIIMNKKEALLLFKIKS